MRKETRPLKFSSFLRLTLKSVFALDPDLEPGTLHGIGPQIIVKF